jgi:hypothetical protein
MQQLRSIGVGSAARVGALTSALIFAVLGIFLVVLPGLFGASLMGAAMGDEGGATGFGVGLIGSLVMYVVLIAVYAIFGGILYALSAWLYNIVAARWGGLEITIE